MATPLDKALSESRVNDEREIVQLPTQTFNDLVDYIKELREQLRTSTHPKDLD